MLSPGSYLPPLKIFWWVAGTLILFKIWLVGGHDLLGKYRIYDDSLFLEHAQSLLNGNWLGELSYRTLIKGPGYPFFIVVAYWLGVPLLTAQQLLYIFACVVMIYALRGWVTSNWILILFFSLVLFNPFTYYYPMVGALMRESVYNSFALLFLATMIGLWVHHSRSIVSGVMWSVTMAIAFSMLWITREETIWTVPGMILFSILFLPGWKWNQNSRVIYRTFLLVVPVLVSIITVYGIARVNAVNYGAPVFIEVKSKEFTSALGSLMNIREDDYRKAQIIGPKSEQAAFRVSPSFASLRPYIKERRKKRPNVFYIWTLRSATNDAGYYADPANIQPALDLYKKIGEEISAACKSGEIRCFDRSPTLQPPLYPEHKAQYPGAFLGLLFDAVSFAGVNADSTEFNSHADMGMLMTFDYVTGESAVRKSVHLEHMRPAFDRDMQSFKEAVMQGIGRAYQFAIPFAVLLALIAHMGAVFSMFRIESRSIVVPLFGFILGGSILGILVILSYVQVTLFDVIRPVTVVYPLLLLYVVSMLSTWFIRKP